MKTRKENIPWNLIIKTMREVLRNQKLPSVSLIALKDNNPFRILISTMISLRTKDDVTLKAFEKLYKKAPTATRLMQLETDKIEELIYPAGFFKTKAKNLKTTARIIEEEFKGKVPDKREELLKLPGVGRKTANLVLNLGFNIPAICVDTHVHRISNRMGWVITRTPDETETALMKCLPKKYWIEINELLVKFGQQICTPQSPWCSKCPLDKICIRTGVSKSR